MSSENQYVTYPELMDIKTSLASITTKQEEITEGQKKLDQSIHECLNKIGSQEKEMEKVKEQVKTLFIEKNEIKANQQSLKELIRQNQKSTENMIKNSQDSMEKLLEDKMDMFYKIGGVIAFIITTLVAIISIQH